MNICPNCQKLSLTAHGECLECGYNQEFQGLKFDKLWIPVLILVIWAIALAWALGDSNALSF